MLKRRWQKTERDTAKREGGCLLPASGARWFAKGDVSAPKKLIQVKSTEKSQYILKLADLELIEAQAAAANKDGKLIVVFITPHGEKRFLVQRDW